VRNTVEGQWETPNFGHP